MSYALFIALLLALGGSYVGWALVTRKPERTLYGFLLIWTLFPKAARIIYVAPQAEDWPDGVTLYTAFEGIAFLGVCAALLSSGGHRSEQATRPIRWFAAILGLTGIVSIVAPLVLSQFPDQIEAAGLWTMASELVEPQWRLMGASSLVYGAIFGVACAEFLRTRKQIEPVFLILLFAGLELTIEAILLYVFHLVPALDRWEISIGRFNSLSYYNCNMVGLMSLLTVGSLLYFAGTRRSPRLLLLLPLLLLPTLLTFERSPILGIGAELCLAAWLLGGRWRIYAIAGAGVLSLLVTLANVPFVELATATLGQDVRPDYLSPETGQIRLALYLRGFDSIASLFPFGSGPGMLRYAMSFWAPETFRMFNTPESMTTYVRVAGGQNTTSSHNAFIEFIGENGLIGVVALGGFGLLALRNYFRWLKLRAEPAAESRYMEVLQACVYSMLCGIALFSQFETTVLPHALNMMLLSMTFVPFIAGTASQSGWTGGIQADG